MRIAIGDLISAISIHALLAESDLQKPRHCQPFCQFLSTLSLRRATFWCAGIPVYAMVFLSTLSLRRATLNSRLRRCALQNFYPRSPCGERRAFISFPRITLPISIHALLAESDRSRPKAIHGCRISIHALLAESDPK